VRVGSSCFFVPPARALIVASRGPTPHPGNFLSPQIFLGPKDFTNRATSLSAINEIHFALAFFEVLASETSETGRMPPSFRDFSNPASIGYHRLKASLATKPKPFVTDRRGRRETVSFPACRSFFLMAILRCATMHFLFAAWPRFRTAPRRHISTPCASTIQGHVQMIAFERDHRTIDLTRCRNRPIDPATSCGDEAPISTNRSIPIRMRRPPDSEMPIN